MLKFLVSLARKFKLFYLVFVIFSVTVYYSFKSVFLIKSSGRKDVFYNQSRRWANLLLKICNVNIVIIGSEHLKEGETYIYASNHSSLFDIPVILSALKDNIRIMYKKELEKIPILGWCLKVSPYISVNRSDPRDAMSGLEESLNSIREDVSVVIYPEGTRSKDGSLGSFKRGAFFLASRSGKPIVPIAIIGTNKILPSRSFEFSRGDVKIIIHKPLTISHTVERKEERQLMDSVRNTIHKSLQSS
jgi:1-acyl-sn-glycerol-3-phosphate acyltransferase